MELYVCLDTVLLAAVVETFRTSTHKHFRLDPMHYVSAPSLCFDAMLKITRMELETLPSVDMYLFINKCIRGGMTGASNRYARANNDCIQTYDSTKPVSHIIGLDANNLYGHSLTQPMPIGDFRWMTADEIKHFDVNAILADDRGYFIEVDLHYPPELHDIHDQFPLAPEKLDIPKEEWSEHTQNLASRLKLKHKSSGMKLMNTLRDKKRYVIHHENLKLYVRLGMQITKVHRGICFKQSDFMRPYITMNNAARKKATSSFEVSLYKFFNNSVFGKCCYNVFRQRHIKLVNKKDRFQKLAARPTFHGSHIINRHLTGVEMKPASIMCDKSLYIGAAVLELSKTHMYSFYYDFLVKKYYRSGLRMIYTDTDSFYLQIFDRPEFYKDILKYEHLFDRSAYPTHHFLHDCKRQRALGLMKDVHADGHITEMVALRSKMYAVRVQRGHEQKLDDDIKAKGVKKSVLRDMKYEMYFDCLKDTSVTKHSFKQIRSFRHRLVTKDSVKVGLCSYDDKRHLLPCGIHSYAYGHWRIADEHKGTHCRFCR